MELLKKYGLPLLGVGLLAGIAQTWVSWGIPYQKAVNHWLVILYTWLMILAVIGVSARFFNFSNHFTEYMNRHSFGLYLFHYVPMVYLAYVLTTWTTLPQSAVYLLVLAGSFLAAVLLSEICSRIPVIRTLFGYKIYSKTEN